MSCHLPRCAFAAFVILALFGCSDLSAGAPKNVKAKTPPAPKAAFDVTKVKLTRTELVAKTRVKGDAAFTTALEATLSSYLGLKDAGVKSDAAAMKAAFGTWQSKFDALKATKPPATAKASFAKQLAAADEGIAIVQKGDDLKSLRRAFSPISEAMVAMAASFEHSASLFVQYCPMALNTGAHWLSKEKPIRNPYYGDMMLECGEVQGTIVPAS